MLDIIMVYITAPSVDNAQLIVQTLLEKSIVACATIFPCHSAYKWNNTIQSSDEVIIMAKTLEERFDQLQHEVVSLHPYSIPCIIKIQTAANIPYAQWVHNEVCK